eukprot:gb/GECG01012841.1/.p1 GENE.gb/GECG01012841.1/~~gb/GECG01012841.1/.p1  ORF type:complete len:2758 (+),score=312.92 gb/GECG01012841.1/:1-8274(+)
MNQNEEATRRHMADSQELTRGRGESESRQGVSNLDAEILVLIARYLNALPGTQAAGQSLETVLEQLGVLRPSLLWTGEQREPSFADIARRLQNVSPMHLRDLIVQHFTPGTIPHDFSRTGLQNGVDDNPISLLTENFANIHSRKLELPSYDCFKNGSAQIVRATCSTILQEQLNRQVGLRYLKLVERCRKLGSQFYRRLREHADFPRLRLLDTSKMRVPNAGEGSIGPSWMPSVLYAVKFHRKTSTRRKTSHPPIAYSHLSVSLPNYGACIDCGRITQIDDGSELELVDADGGTLEADPVSQLILEKQPFNNDLEVTAEIPPFQSTLRPHPSDIVVSRNDKDLSKQDLNVEDGDILRIMRPARRLAHYLQEDTSSAKAKRVRERIIREVEWYDFAETTLAKRKDTFEVGGRSEPLLNTKKGASTFTLPQTETGLTGRLSSTAPRDASAFGQDFNVVSFLGNREIELRCTPSPRPRRIQDWHSSMSNATAGRLVSTPNNKIRSATGRTLCSSAPPHMLYTQRLSPLGAVSGHMGQPAYCVAYDMCNDFVISGADDNLVKVWSATYGHLIATLRGMDGVLQDLSVNSSNQYVAAASDESSAVIRVWSMQDWSSAAILVGHTKMVNFLEFDPVFSSILVSVSDDGTCRVWDIGGYYSATHANYNMVRSTDASNSATGKPVEDTATSVNVEDYMDVNNDPEGREAAAALQRELRQRRSSRGGSTDEFFREAVERSLEHNPCYVLNHKDDTVKKGKTLLRQGSLLLGDSETKVTSVSVSPLGGVIATGTQNGIVRIYSLLSSACSQDACSKSWTVCNNVIRASDKEAVDTSSGGRSRTRVSGYGKMSNHVLHRSKHTTATGTGCTYKTGGSSATSGGSTSAVTVLEDAVLSPELRLVCQGHTSTVNSIAFSHSGDRVASSGAKDGTVRVWTFSRHYDDYVCLILDARRGEYATDYADLQNAFKSKDRNAIASKIRQNIEEGCNIEDLHDGSGGGVVTDSKSEVLAIGKKDSAQFWDAQSAYYSDENVGFGFCGRVGKDHSRTARSAWWKQEVPVPEIDQIAWTKDDSCIISSQRIMIETKWEDDASSYFFIRLKVWCSHTGELLRVFTGHDGPVFVIEPSPLDPHIFLSGGQDGRLNIWDCGELRTQPLTQFEFHRLEDRSDRPSLVNSSDLSVPFVPRTREAGDSSSRQRKSKTSGSDRRPFLGGAVVQLQSSTCAEGVTGFCEVHVESMSSSLDANKYHACKDMRFSSERAGVLDIKWQNDGLGFVVTDVEGRVTWFGVGGVEWSLHYHDTHATVGEDLACVASGMELRSTTQSAVCLYLVPFFQYFSLDYEPLMRDIYYNVIDRAHQVPPHQLLPEQNIGNEFFEDYPFIPEIDCCVEEKDAEDNSFEAEVVTYSSHFYQRLFCGPVRFVPQYRRSHTANRNNRLTRDCQAKNIIEALHHADRLFGARSHDSIDLKNMVESLFHHKAGSSYEGAIHIKASYGTSANRRLGRTAIRQQERRRTQPVQYLDDSSDEETSAVHLNARQSADGPLAGHVRTRMENALSQTGRAQPADSGLRHPRTMYSNRYAVLSYLQQLTRRARAFARSHSRGTSHLQDGGNSSILMEEHIESRVRCNQNGGMELASDYESDDEPHRQIAAAAAPSRSRSSRRTSRPIHLRDSMDDSAGSSDESDASADTVDNARERSTLTASEFFEQDQLAQLFSSVVARASYDLRVAPCIRGLRIQGISHVDEAMGENLLDKCQKSLISGSMCYSAEGLNSATSGLTRLGFKPQRDESEASLEAKTFRRVTRYFNEWLLRTRPTPCNYLPQIGDDVIYFPEGHAEVLGVDYFDDGRDFSQQSGQDATIRGPSTRAKRQRETKEITVRLTSRELGIDCERAGRIDNGALGSKPSHRFPWQKWPASWRYVRCSVVAINYVFCYQQDAKDQGHSGKGRKGMAADYAVILEVTLRVSHAPTTDSSGNVSWQSVESTKVEQSDLYFRQYVGPNGCVSLPELEAKRCGNISVSSNDTLSTTLTDLRYAKYEGVNCLVLIEEFEHGMENMNRLQDGTKVEVPFIDVASALDCCEEDVFGRYGGYDILKAQQFPVESASSSAATTSWSGASSFCAILSPGLRSRSSASANSATRLDVERPSRDSQIAESMLKLANNPTLKGRLLCESIEDSVEAAASALVMRKVDALDHPKWKQQVEKKSDTVLDPHVREDIWGAVSNYIVLVQELKSTFGEQFEIKSLLPVPLSKMASYYTADVSASRGKKLGDDRQRGLPCVWCSIPVTFEENGDHEFVSPWEINGPSTTDRPSKDYAGCEPSPMEQWKNHSSMVRYQFRSSLTEEQRCKALKTILELKKVPEYASFLYDVSATQFPQYSKHVPVPMSLYRIAQRLIRHYYRSLESILNDVELIRINCASFNEPDSDIIAVATACVRDFHEKFESMSLRETRGSRRAVSQPSPEPEPQLEIGENIEEIKGAVANTRIYNLSKRSLEEIAGTLPSSMTQAFHKILDWVAEADVLSVFSEPVPEDFTDYHDEIKFPQDYTTMRREIESGQYSTVQKFSAELQLIYANAIKFNEEGDKYWMLAARSFQYAAPILQAAQEKFQTPVSVDLPMIPSTLPVDIDQFIVEIVNNQGSGTTGLRNGSANDEIVLESEDSSDDSYTARRQPARRNRIRRRGQASSSPGRRRSTQRGRPRGGARGRSNSSTRRGNPRRSSRSGQSAANTNGGMRRTGRRRNTRRAAIADSGTESSEYEESSEDDDDDIELELESDE